MIQAGAVRVKKTRGFEQIGEAGQVAEDATKDAEAQGHTRGVTRIRKNRQEGWQERCWWLQAPFIPVNN